MWETSGHVGGFTDPQRSRVGLGALLVGYFEGDHIAIHRGYSPHPNSQALQRGQALAQERALERRDAPLRDLTLAWSDKALSVRRWA